MNLKSRTWILGGLCAIASALAFAEGFDHDAKPDAQLGGEFVKQGTSEVRQTFLTKLEEIVKLKYLDKLQVAVTTTQGTTLQKTGRDGLVSVFAKDFKSLEATGELNFIASGAIRISRQGPNKSGAYLFSIDVTTDVGKKANTKLTISAKGGEAAAINQISVAVAELRKQAGVRAEPGRETLPAWMSLVPTAHASQEDRLVLYRTTELLLYGAVQATFAETLSPTQRADWDRAFTKAINGL